MRQLVPEHWKTCLLSVIPKGKGLITDPAAWRGISMKCVMAKLLSALLAKRLYRYLEVSGAIPEEQHGFVHGKSTETALSSLLDIVRDALSMPRRPKYVAFLDFKAAFDTASRKGIVEKLARLGVFGNFLLLVVNLLSGNNVIINDGIRHHAPFTQRTGLPQGDTISSLLFVVLLHDLPAHLKALFPSLRIILYADDIALLADDLEMLRAAVEELMRFCANLGLELNVGKSKVMKFRRGGHLAATDKLIVRGSEIEFVNSFSYLGFYLTTSLGSFNRHIEERRTVALMKMLSLPDLRLLSLETASKIFRLIISPCAVYGIRTIWESLNKGNMEMLEGVKMLFLKRVLGVSKFARNRTMYIISGCSSHCEDLVAVYALERTTALNIFLSELESKLGDVDPDIFRTQALNSESWKRPMVELRHVVCRTAAHGFHHHMCLQRVYHEVCESCICRFCGVHCKRYHYLDCRQSPFESEAQLAEGVDDLAEMDVT
jgi:hypothetical protein